MSGKPSRSTPRRRGTRKPGEGTRVPVHVAAASGHLSVQERIWATIRSLAGRKRIAGGSATFTRPDIEHAAQATEGSVRWYTEHLVAGGYLVAVGPQPKRNGWFRHTQFRLARDVGVQAPRLRPDGTPSTLGLAREQMWRTVKILGEFSAADLALTASTPERAIALEDAKQYVCALARGGYVACTRKAKSGLGRQLARYRFVPARNTGPRPPMIQRRTRAVFDPNLGRIVWPR